MMNMKNLMKKAHELTRKIKGEFPEVDYKFQLGLCLSFLSKEGAETIELKELEGSEKQVAWAEEIRNNALEIVNRNGLKKVKELIYSEKSAKFFIDNFKPLTSKYLDSYEKFKRLMNLELRLSK